MKQLFHDIPQHLIFFDFPKSNCGRKCTPTNKKEKLYIVKILSIFTEIKVHRNNITKIDRLTTFGVIANFVVVL